jgi:hypothetical protein
MKEAAMAYVRRLQTNFETARKTVLVRMEQVKKKQKLTYDASRRETTSRCVKSADLKSYCTAGWALT